MKQIQEVKLRDWQAAALAVWMKGKRGTIEGTTGSGKTQIGIEALKQLDCSTLIVVPTITLLYQWKLMLLNNGINDEDIGIVGDGNKEIGRKVTIGCINTIRDRFDIFADLLIVDEIHRIGSAENRRVLDRSFEYFLGLSATPEREEIVPGENFYLALFPVVYRYKLEDAIKAKDVCDYENQIIDINLTSREEEDYKKLQEAIRTNFPYFNNDLHYVAQACRHNSRAKKLMGDFQARKTIVLNAENKFNICKDLIMQHKNDRVIIFCELIKTAERLKILFKGNGISCEIYHSKQTKFIRTQVLENYQANKINCIIACKALDEGVDFPETNVGIIFGGTKTRRQIIQRLGRIIRYRVGKIAKLYQFCVKGTIEEKWVKSRNLYI